MAALSGFRATTLYRVVTVLQAPFMMKDDKGKDISQVSFIINYDKGKDTNQVFFMMMDEKGHTRFKSTKLPFTPICKLLIRPTSFVKFVLIRPYSCCL